VVIDAKGGFDSRDAAGRARGVLRDLGARHVAVWPDEVGLNLWALPPARLAEVLVDLVPVAAEGPAAYYADVLAAVVALAVQAAHGPPVNSRDFLSRLDPAWLARAYAGSPGQAARVESAGKHVGDVRLRYETLFGRLGAGFDGPHQVTDFDALYCIVEGTARGPPWPRRRRRRWWRWSPTRRCRGATVATGRSGGGAAGVGRVLRCRRAGSVV